MKPMKWFKMIGQRLWEGSWQVAVSRQVLLPCRLSLTKTESNPNDDHSFLMFSATFPKGARALANEYMSEDRVRFSVGRAGSTHNFIQQRIVWTEDSAKQQALFDLLHALPPARTLVFVNTRKKADLVDDYLYNKGLPSTSIHSDRNQREREDAL